MVVWYGIVEYCGLDTLILIKGRRRCQIFAQFETISEYINSSVEKALSGLPAPNIPTSHIGNENISKWSNWTLGELRLLPCLPLSAQKKILFPLKLILQTKEKNKKKLFLCQDYISLFRSLSEWYFPFVWSCNNLTEVFKVSNFCIFAKKCNIKLTKKAKTQCAPQKKIGVLKIKSSYSIGPLWRVTLRDKYSESHADSAGYSSAG